MRSTTDGLKNRQRPGLMDSAFSLMDAFPSLFSLFTKEKERERADQPKKRAMDENGNLMDKTGDLMEKPRRLVMNFHSTINDLARNNGKSIKFVHTARQPFEIRRPGKKIEAARPRASLTGFWRGHFHSRGVRGGLHGRASAPHQGLDKALQFGDEGRLERHQALRLRSGAQLIDQGVQAVCIFPTLRFARLALPFVLAPFGAAVLQPWIVAAPVQAVARGIFFLNHLFPQNNGLNSTNRPRSLRFISARAQSLPKANKTVPAPARAFLCLFSWPGIKSMRPETNKMADADLAAS